MAQNFNKIGSNTFFITVLISSFFIGIGASYLRYYYLKQYFYIVEAACDPQKEKCLVRDCENNPDSCPPNNLSTYKKFKINAIDFPKCKDNSCKDECESGEILCSPVIENNN